MREPDAHVTGIHISEASLGHTREPQRIFGLDLHRLAIEEAGKLGRTFDEIVCTGLLHHLPDPDAGFARCVACSSPIGLCMSWSMGLMGAPAFI